jgi:hypothetical protein
MADLSPVPGGKFTDEMLAKNFVSIASGFQDMERWMSHMEGHITELYQMAKAAAEVKVKTPSRVKPFLIGAAVGIVVYRYGKQYTREVKKVLQDEGVSVQVGKAADAAKERLNPIVDKAKDVVNDKRD